eukprot:TRINITY_DN48599_c0_g1_i1.p1 TRINITY_DN48599_c0_g1~~TRINITY_DN48599_c0_g1_i1.p1  ORF type:complete len:128 (+),score=10.99 TRINITY_DN48599_c0_g1_i1:61-444(+)
MGVWIFTLLSVLCASAPAVADVVTSQHVYAAGPEGSDQSTSIVGYFNCKPNCHLLDGKRAEVSSSQWSSLVRKQVYLEETAGWLLLWQDQEYSTPLLPTKAEFASTYDNNEPGYLKGSKGIALQVSV